MGYENLLADERTKVATDAAELTRGRGGVFLAAKAGERMKQGVRGMMGIEEPVVTAAKAAEAKQLKLNTILSKYSNAKTRAEFTSAFSELMAAGFPEHAAKIQEHLKNMPKPKEYSIIEGYKLAKDQGYDKGFFQYQIDLKQAASEKNISIGNIPQGFEVITNSKGNIEMRVIPGGPADIEQTELTVKGQAEQMLKQNDAAIVLKNVSLVREAVLNPKQILGFTISPVGFGSWLKDVPSTPAMGVKNMIKTIKANIGFGKLQSMREVSPTGGALGQVSNIELELLTSVIGGLEQAQSKEDVLRVLDQIEQTYNMIVHGQTGLEIIYGNTDPAEVD